MYKGFLTCKKCGRRIDREHFLAFLETPTAKTHLYDACCDDCWDPTDHPTKGRLTCNKCKSKRDREHFLAFLKTPTAKTNLGDASPVWASLDESALVRVSWASLGMIRAILCEFE